MTNKRNFGIMDEMSHAMDNYFCESDNNYVGMLENIASMSGVILFDGEKIKNVSKVILLRVFFALSYFLPEITA